MIEFNLEVSLPPTNDFYLQWQDIYWWQMKFNLTYTIRENNGEIEMTKKEKTNVNDIIGIIKTDEPTNSVNEVRKLRGRENKFTVYINWRNKEKGITNEVVLKDGGQPIAEITSYEDAWRLRDMLNDYAITNYRLTQDNKRLRNTNKRLRKGYDKMYDLCKEHFTDEEIIKELSR